MSTLRRNHPQDQKGRNKTYNAQGRKIFVVTKTQEIKLAWEKPNWKLNQTKNALSGQEKLERAACLYRNISQQYVRVFIFT